MTTIMFLWAAAVLANPGSALTTYSSAYYSIESDLPPERVKHLGMIMDAAGKEYDRRFTGYSGKVLKKLKLKVYATKEDFVEAVKRASDGSKAWATSGVFVPIDETVYTYDGPSMEHVLRHECFHQFVHFVVGGHLDPWVNEGLAEYFAVGRVDPSSGTLQLGRVEPHRAAQLALAKENNSLMSVDRVLKISGQDWHANMGTEDAGTQYAQGWALCHFLIHSDGGKYQKYFDEYLRLIDKHLDGPSAFKRVFGEDTRELQKKYAAYVDQLIAEGAQEEARSLQPGRRKSD